MRTAIEQVLLCVCVQKRKWLEALGLIIAYDK